MPILWIDKSEVVWEQNGISLESYYYWISKFRKLAVVDPSEKRIRFIWFISFSQKQSDLDGSQFALELLYLQRGNMWILTNPKPF